MNATHKIHKILAVADARMRPSASLARAAALAERTGGAVHLVLVDHRASLAERFRANGQREAQRRALAAYLAPRREWLDAQTEALRAKGIAATNAVIWGKPLHREVIDQAHEVGADLVIKDALVEPMLKRLVRPPEDWHLLRDCPVPVLLVNEHSSTWPQRIIAAVDPYDAHGKPHALNQRIVETALELGQLCGAEVRLVHVLDFVPIPIATMGVVVDPGYERSYYDRMRVEHRAALERFAQAFGIPAASTALLEGRPEEAMASYADATLCDLVVVGAVRRNGLDRLAFGTTSEQIIHRLHCDVVVVKPDALVQALEHELVASRGGPLDTMQA